MHCSWSGERVFELTIKEDCASMPPALLLLQRGQYTAAARRRTRQRWKGNGILLPHHRIAGQAPKHGTAAITVYESEKAHGT